jgi:choline monooxygenase
MDDLSQAFDPSLPLERARTIPASWYRDSAIYARECRHVFAATWQVVGRAEQVREPGSFFTAELAGEPLLVVRDEAGVLRGFFNVCRHRAAQVMPQAEGRATKLRCRYHGWTYDLAGRLRGTPEFDGVEDFCRENEGLREFTVAVWGPLVFAHLDPPQESVEHYLAPLAERVTEVGLDRLRFVERRIYHLACNWKVFIDNYLDGGYHVTTVHPELAGVLDYSQYRTETFANTSVQISPLRASGEAAAAVRGGHNAYYWWVFPNFMMNVYEGVMDTNLVLPRGPDACDVVFDFYFAKVEGAEAFIAESIAVADRIQAEDTGVCAEVQRGLGSRSYQTGRYSVRREAGVHHFHKLLARRLQAGS